MEAMLAAYGSGAAQQSHDRSERILNIDIGGGTTKLSVIDKGEILSTAAIHVGSRLIAFDAQNRLERLDPAGETHAGRAGFDWKLGDRPGDADLQAVAESMANDVVAALTGDLSGADEADLYLTDPIEFLDDVASVVCSGGVAEYIYRREDREFGDLGKRLGLAIRQRLDSGRLPWQLLPDSHGIRSTALGCSEFTAQLSGNTGYISDPESLLPRRNLKVLRPTFEFTEDFDADGLADAIRRHMVMFEVDAAGDELVLAFHWEGTPSYRRIRRFADAIRAALAARIEAGSPIYVILDADIAMNLGNILHKDLGIDNEVLVIDGIALWDFDSVDIGKLRQPSNTVPVTIKSLIFSDVVDGVHRRELVHHPRTATRSMRSAQ